MLRSTRLKGERPKLDARAADQAAFWQMRSRAGYDFAPRTLSWINPAIRARVSIAIDENSAGVFRTIGLASVNRVRA